jgi:hypothetical protein
MSTDPDRQTVYYAEGLAFEGTLYTEALHTKEFTELAWRLFTHPWWARNSIPVPIILPTDGNDTASCAKIYHPYSIYGDDREPELHISPYDINVHTLAHEAAHVAQYHFFPLAKNPNVQDHGEEFRTTYVTIANILLGSDAAAMLSDSFSRFFPDFAWNTFLLDLDDSGSGIYPTWRAIRSADALLQTTKNAPKTSPLRINGAIAL